MSVIVGVGSVVAIGYLSLGFVKEKGHREIQKETLQVIGESDRARVEVQAAGVERAAELGNRSLTMREEEAERRRQEQERRADSQRLMQEQRLEAQRLEQERRAELQREAQRRSQVQEEERKAARQRAYWTCLNAALDRVDITSAELRCAHYK